MNKKLKIMIAAIVFAAVMWSIIAVCLKLAGLHNIYQYASGIEEPAYTLVVNGKIIEHDYDVSFDRFYSDPDTGELVGYIHGDTEVPLLTVLAAMGAEISWVTDNIAEIRYAGQTYVLLPLHKAILSESRYRELTAQVGQIPADYDLDNYDILLHTESENACRWDGGEFILPLGHLHLLAMGMGFEFQCHYERGILFFTTD